MMLLRVLTVAVLLSPSALAYGQTCPGPPLSFDYDAPAIAELDRRLFQEADRILRLPSDGQALQIAYVYNDVFAVLYPRRYPLANWRVEPWVSLDDLKPILRGNVSGPYHSMYAQQASLAMFAAHPKQTQPLIRRDLRSAVPGEVARGISVARAMDEPHFPDLYDDLKAIFLGRGPCSEEALASLFSYAGFPRVSANRRPTRASELLPLLVSDFHKSPERYAAYLQYLLSDRPAPAVLLAAADSPDATLRHSASRALMGNRDPRLGPYVRRMLTDATPAVRRNAFHMGLLGFRRGDAAYKEIKPAVDRLLRDADWGVQLDALRTYAHTGDRACVPVLVDVFRKWAAGDATVPDLDFSQLANLAESIAHLKFGFRDDEPPSRNDRLTNQAIGRFADWAKAQKP